MACIVERAEKKTMEKKKKLVKTGVINVTANVNLKMEGIQIKVKAAFYHLGLRGGR